MTPAECMERRTEARSWTIEHTGRRPLTVNAVAGLHRQQWASITRETREAWGWLTRGALVPSLAGCTIVAQPLHANRRSPQDVAACAPEAKAAIDGIVDAGVIPNDDATHLLSVTFLPPDICGRDGLRIEITEALPVTEAQQ